MAVELLNIPGRAAPEHFSHVSVAPGGRLVHMAGQVGTDETGRVVPGGLASQAQRARLNVSLALEAAGATDADLAKLTVYVVDWRPEKLQELGAGLLAAQSARPSPKVPITLIGVSSLAEPDLVVEIEGVGVF